MISVQGEFTVLTDSVQARCSCHESCCCRCHSELRFIHLDISESNAMKM